MPPGKNSLRSRVGNTWRLADDGVLVINVGRTPTDRRLIDAMVGTIGSDPLKPARCLSVQQLHRDERVVA